MMDSRILDPPHAQFGGSLGGVVGFPYHLSHHHVYELAGHQLQSASAVPFSIDGLLNGSCTASVGNSNPLLSSGCGMNGDNHQYKLSGKPHYPQHNELCSRLASSKWRKKENTKKGPGRPAHNAHPTTCSGEPMDPEEIARRELDRMEKKKRKQERRLLKSQNKLVSGDLFHTPGSDSDSGVSHVTDSDHNTCPPFDSVGGNQSRCDLQSQNQNQRHLDRDAGGSELDSPDPSHRSSLCSSNTNRASSMQKLNPFSVESLLSDSRPRRNPAALPSSRPLIGKGHFLLYPITQPLGFIVPQTALKTSTAGANSDGETPADRDQPGVRCSASANSPGCRSSSPDAQKLGQVGQEEKSSPSRAVFPTGQQSSVICSESTFELITPVNTDKKEHLEHTDKLLSDCPTQSNSTEDVDLE
ncbi:hypothetical protein XENOCAPTIV_017186 [Xenoophorus captivus]|uniref:Uncharacterized protein n=1 Tax=Xenoophorus captivus TaxID=1517983 RepID=A0ABV0QU43_9TELE